MNRWFRAAACRQVHNGAIVGQKAAVSGIRYFSSRSTECRADGTRTTFHAAAFPCAVHQPDLAFLGTEGQLRVDAVNARRGCTRCRFSCGSSAGPRRSIMRKHTNESGAGFCHREQKECLLQAQKARAWPFGGQGCKSLPPRRHRRKVRSLLFATFLCWAFSWTAIPAKDGCQGCCCGFRCYNRGGRRRRLPARASGKQTGDQGSEACSWKDL